MEKDSTLLLVSHDVYSAANLVERMIWISDGQIILDDKPKIVLNAYEDSVRTFEEARLRKKSLTKLSQRMLNNEHLVVAEFSAYENIPFEQSVYFHKVRLDIGDDFSIDASLFDEPSDEGCSGIIKEKSCWGSVCDVDGKSARVMNNFGSSFHKVSVFFNLTSEQAEKFHTAPSILTFEAYSGCEFKFLVSIFNKDGLFSSELTTQKKLNVWNNYQIDLTSKDAPLQFNLNQHGQIGAGGVLIRDVRFINEVGVSSNIFKHAEPVKIAVSYTITHDLGDVDYDVIIALLKNGTETACRYAVNNIKLAPKGSKYAVLTVDVGQLSLGAGEYSLTLLIAKGDYIYQQNMQFYAINPDVYYCGRDLFNFSVTADSIVAQGAPYVANANWTVKCAEVEVV